MAKKLLASGGGNTSSPKAPDKSGNWIKIQKKALSGLKKGKKGK